MTDIKVKKAADKAHYLDAETRHILSAIKSKNNKALAWFIISWSILLAVGVSGIYRQNQIAIQNKKHIDCIIKDLATPPPKGASPNAKKYIENLSTDCNIKFTQ